MTDTTPRGYRFPTDDSKIAKTTGPEDSIREDFETLAFDIDRDVTTVDARIADVEELKLDASDPRTPLLAPDDPYSHASIDKRRRLGHGIRTADGVSVIPAGVETPFAGLPLEGFLHAMTDRRRRMTELTLDSGGRFPSAVAEAIVMRGIRGRAYADGLKYAPLEVTRPLNNTGVMADTSVQARYPIKNGFLASRWRVAVSNYNELTDTAYLPLAVDGLWFGEAATDSIGRPTGAWASAPRKIQGAFTATGDTFYTAYIDDYPMLQDKVYLIALSYTNAAGNNVHGPVGGCFRSSVAADVTALDPVQTRRQGGPLQIHLEVGVDPTTPVNAHFADSLGVGSGAELPVYDSYAHVHARKYGAVPVLFAQHGSQMTSWSGNAGGRQWIKYDHLCRADGVLWELGTNDIFGNQLTYAQMLDVWALTLPLVRRYISDRIFYATVMPRNSESTPEVKAVRHQWNAHLATLPGNALGLFDFAAAIADPADPDRILPEYDSDNTHLTTSGYLRVSETITSGIASATLRPLNGATP